MIADELKLKDDTHDSFADSFLAQDRAKGSKIANQRARALLTAAWRTRAGAVSRISGKAALSALSSWSKETHGVSFGITTLLQEIRRSEIDPEIVSTLYAIEEQTDFQD